VEEGLILSGSLTDQMLNKTSLPGDYCQILPGCPHGPYLADPTEGCLVFVITRVSGGSKMLAQSNFRQRARDPSPSQTFRSAFLIWHPPELEGRVRLPPPAGLLHGAGGGPLLAQDKCNCCALVALSGFVFPAVLPRIAQACFHTGIENQPLFSDYWKAISHLRRCPGTPPPPPPPRF